MFLKLAFCLFVVLLACLFFYQLLLLDIPDVSFLKTKNPARSSFMNWDFFDKENDTITFVSLQDISPSVIRAVLAAEDDTFFEHSGFNWKAIQKSWKTNWKKKRILKGGSTITQQLARNLFLTKQKSITRKLREALLTYQLENTLNKQRIMELYLNYAEFGPGIYGVAEASRYHFLTKPKNLTATQSALLAAVLPNPKKYGHKPYPGVTYWRQKMILNHMSYIGPLPTPIPIPNNVSPPIPTVEPVPTNTPTPPTTIEPTNPPPVFVDE